MMPYSMKFAKKAKIKIKFQKMKVVFGQHPLVEKSPTATDLKYFFIKSINNKSSILEILQNITNQMNDTKFNHLVSMNILKFLVRVEF